MDGEKKEHTQCVIATTKGKMSGKRNWSFNHHLLWLLVFHTFLGLTQQQGISRSWDRTSRLVPNFVYERRESVAPPSSSDNNQIVHAPPLHLLEENNVMDILKLDKNKEQLPDEEEEEEEEAEEKAREVELAQNHSRENVNEEEGVEEDYNDDYESEDNQKISNSSEIVHRDPENAPEDNQDYLSGEEDEIGNHDDLYVYYDDNEKNNSSQHDNLDLSEVVPDEMETNSEINSSVENKNVDTVPLKQNSSQVSIEQEETYVHNSSSIENKDKDDSIVDTSKTEDEPSGSIWIGEAIVSVVTTKSVVNGTISIPETTSSPLTTESVLSSPTSSPTTIQPLSNTTDDSSIILASVQTSRSVSGARFLPFPVIDRVEELNLNSSTAPSKETSLTSESTESIIDKLDERQSELSSGILSNGFRPPSNTLQLDLLDRDRTTTRKRYGTTSRTPIISKFVPRRYNDKKLEHPSTADAPTTSSTMKTTSKLESMEEDLDDVLLKDFPIDESTIASTSERIKIPLRWPSRPTLKQTNIHTTSPATITSKIKNVKIQDVSAFLPPGYKLKKDDTEVKEPASILSDILSKSKLNVSSFLPPGYTKPTKNLSKEKSLETSTQKGIIEKSIIGDLFSKSSVDISLLLPKDYVEKKIPVTEVVSSTPTIATNKSDNGLKIVFPSRPGGRKPIYRISTPSSSRDEGAGGVTPRIQKGWPTRATTEFTGWPTSSTTPISIEKLLEAARTATIASMNASITPTTSLKFSTSTTSTTTTTQRSTTPGTCEDECEVAGTIRIVGNTTWLPELLDRNTYEWQELADEVENELHVVFSKSNDLKNWYKKIRIDSFSQGSILVDYFVELNGLAKQINTQELKIIFHNSLKSYNVEQYNDTETNGTIKLGRFAIDSKSTDFVVIPKVTIPQYIEKHDGWIPQWAIAVIVIGVGGLLFIIVFGVSVLINRKNEGKLKPTISTIYEGDVTKNMMQTNHASSSHRSLDYPKHIHTIWNDPDVSWNDRSFESNSNKILVDRSFPPDERKYNLYDSWRSEWNGYYCNASHPNSKYAGYDKATNLSSRHHPDYDTNF